MSKWLSWEWVSELACWRCMSICCRINKVCCTNTACQNNVQSKKGTVAIEMGEIQAVERKSDFLLGSRVGAVVRALAFHQCIPGSIPGPGVICGLSLLVLYSAPRGFSPGTPVFPSPQKPAFDLIWLIWLLWFDWFDWFDLQSPQLLVEHLCLARMIWDLNKVIIIIIIIIIIITP